MMDRTEIPGDIGTERTVSPGLDRGPPPEERPLPLSGQGKRRSPRRLLVIGALVLLGLIGIVGGTQWWLQASRYETTDDAFIDTHMVRVSPQIAGRVSHVLVDDNQDVKVGELLIEIDPADVQAKLDQALANEAASTGSLAQAKAQLAAAQANVEELHAEVGVADANATNAENQLKRDQPLAANQVVSRQQLDNDTANARATAANLDAARKKEATARAQLGVATSQIATAEANLRSAAAQVRQARLDLSYTRITAPLAGHITHKNVADGDYLQIGQNVMALVPHEVWITANFKETQLDHMRPGQPVDIAIDAYPGKVFHGHVDSIQHGGGAAFSLLPPENATGNYVKVVQRVPVKIVFDGPIDPEYNLGPGISVVPAVKIK